MTITLGPFQIKDRFDAFELKALTPFSKELLQNNPQKFKHKRTAIYHLVKHANEYNKQRCLMGGPNLDRK